MEEKVKIYISPALYDRNEWSWHDLADTLADTLKQHGWHDDARTARQDIASATSENAARRIVTSYAEVYVGYGRDKAEDERIA